MLPAGALAFCEGRIRGESLKLGKPPSVAIGTKLNGRLYSGQYSISDGLVTVTYGSRTKSTAVGNGHEAPIARMLLGELVNAELKRGLIRERLTHKQLPTRS